MDQYEIATAMLIDEYVSIGILGLEFFLVIEMRRLSTLPIWTPMLIGAGLMVGLGVIISDVIQLFHHVVSFNIITIMAFGGIALYSLSKERIQL